MKGNRWILALAGAALLGLPGCSGCAGREFRFGRPNASEDTKARSARKKEQPAAAKEEPSADAPREVPEEPQAAGLSSPKPYTPRASYPEYPWPRRPEGAEVPREEDPLPSERFEALTRRLAETPGELLLRQEAAVALLAEAGAREGLSWGDLAPLPPDPGPVAIPPAVRALDGKRVDLSGFLVRSEEGGAGILVPSLWRLRTGRCATFHERILVEGMAPAEGAQPRPVRLRGLVRIREAGGRALYVLQAAEEAPCSGGQALLAGQDEG